MQIFGTSINGIQGALKGMQAAIRVSVRSLGALKLALAATGIGLILIAWQAFNIALGASKRLQDELRVSTAAATALWDAFKGVIADSAEELLGLNDELDDNAKKLSFVEKATFRLSVTFLKLGLITTKTAAGLIGTVVVA